MTTLTNFQKRTDMLLWLSFASVYILWGSTYLALRFALETMPPFIMASSRFLIAGSILLLYSKLTHQKWPNFTEFKNACYVGFLLLNLGNGGVVWAEQYIESGITALIVTIEPVWVVLIMWLLNKNNKPTPIVVFGIVLGLIGIIVLVNPFEQVSFTQFKPLALVALMISSVCWALGSVFGKLYTLPESSVVSIGIQMLFAGCVFILFSFFHGDWNGFVISDVSYTSINGLIYLIVFGSLIGFSSYTYLVKNVSPTIVSTYAFVNPIVAVFLGWWIGKEVIGVQTINAALLLVTAVVIIIINPKINVCYLKNKFF